MLNVDMQVMFNYVWNGMIQNANTNLKNACLLPVKISVENLPNLRSNGDNYLTPAQYMYLLF